MSPMMKYSVQCKEKLLLTSADLASDAYDACFKK